MIGGRERDPERAVADVAAPSLADLCADVPGSLGLEDGLTACSPNALPAWAAALLHHRRHMTLVLGEACGEPVTLRVLDQQRRGEQYSRLITLHRPSDQSIVEVGLVRVHLDRLAPPVTREILLGKRPLGAILADLDVLRRVEPRSFLQASPRSRLAAMFAREPAPDIFARLGTISCDGATALEVFEAVAPLAGATNGGNS